MEALDLALTLALALALTLALALALTRLEALEYEALGALLGLEGAQVAARGKTVRSKPIAPHLPASPHISLPTDCPARLPRPIAPIDCPARLPSPIAPTDCPTLLPHPIAHLPASSLYLRTSPRIPV